MTLPICLSLQSRMPQTLSPFLFPNCRNATILLSLLLCCQSLSMVVAWWWCGCGIGGVRVVGCGLGVLWVLWHGFLLGSRTSFDPTSLHIWFHDEKARKDFLENLSSCGIHSEHHVVLSNFSNTTLPTVIHSRGWESLCEIPVRCPTVIIQEFYSNMHSFNTSIPQFVT